MKIVKQKHIKSLIIISTILVVAFIIGVGGAYYLRVGPFADKVNMNRPTNEEKQAGSDIKKQSVEQVTEGGKTQTGSDPAPAPQPIEGSVKKSVGMEITATNQDSTTVYIRVMIQAVVNSGICTLSMTGPNNKQYSATAEVQSLPSSTTCKGFNVPLNQLAAGTWKATIEFSNDTLAASTRKEVTVQ